MSKAKRPKYCWDTSVFLAWIKAEEGSPLDDIELVADEIDGDKADLIVPVTIYTEVLEAKHTKKQIGQFQLFLKRSNVHSVDTTIGIAQKASDIRSRALKEGRKLKTPDATVIATALIYGADVLHSLDPHILGLNGSAASEGLRICLPQLITGQKALPGLASPEEDH